MISTTVLLKLISTGALSFLVNHTLSQKFTQKFTIGVSVCVFAPSIYTVPHKHPCFEFLCKFDIVNGLC